VAVSSDLSLRLVVDPWSILEGSSPSYYWDLKDSFRLTKIAQRSLLIHRSQGTATADDSTNSCRILDDPESALFDSSVEFRIRWACPILNCYDRQDSWEGRGDPAASLTILNTSQMLVQTVILWRSGFF